MNFEIHQTSDFKVAAKALSKRYKSFKEDLRTFADSLRENPMQGVEIAPHVRKVRLAVHSKGKGKSGGLRVITYTALVREKDGKLWLVLIYDKSEASNVKINALKALIRRLSLDV